MFCFTIPILTIQCVNNGLLLRWFIKYDIVVGIMALSFLMQVKNLCAMNEVNALE